jgi:RNA polymerase sigma factor (TIGR02999 family)
MSDVSPKPTAANRGTNHTGKELLPQVYEELRRLAFNKLAHERPGQTLQPTALVHEAWLRLAGSTDPGWAGRTHFFAAAAEAMRRILVENARRKQRIKHGGGHERVELDALEVAGPLPDEELLALDEALIQLAEADPEAAKLVNLRFFVGMTQAQAAEQLGISRSTADRTWLFARAWLFQRIRLPDQRSKQNHSSRSIS